MGKLHRVGLLTCVLALACSSRSARDVSSGQSAVAKSGTRASQDAGALDPRLDAAGKLKPSELRASWVELPSGFQPQPGSTRLSATFQAHDIPLAKVTDYFEERLRAGTLELRANGISYRNAKPTHTQLPLPKVDVTVLEVDRTQRLVRIVVDDLSPPSEPPLRVDVAARELDRERKNIE